MDDEYYIYVALLDGIPRYVGAGRKKREQHVNSGCSHNVKLNRVVLAEQREFEVQKVKIDLTKDEAFRLECEYIEKYGLESDGGTLWNETYGGIGYLSKHTEKTKERIGAAVKERWAVLKNDPDKYKEHCDLLRTTPNTGRFVKGRVVSEEEKKLRSQSLTGQKRSLETRAKMSAAHRKKTR